MLKPKICVSFSLNFHVSVTHKLIFQLSTSCHINRQDLGNRLRYVGEDGAGGRILANTKNVIIYISRYDHRFSGKNIRCELLRTAFYLLYQLAYIDSHGCQQKDSHILFAS